MNQSKRTWFYWGGFTPQCWSSSLMVEDNRLFCRRCGEWCEVLPTEIREIREFGFNNPFLLIETTSGRFHVGAMTGQYDDVVHFLQRHVGTDFCNGFAHRWNAFFYRRQFRLLSLIKNLFPRRNKDAEISIQNHNTEGHRSGNHPPPTGSDQRK